MFVKRASIIFFILTKLWEKWIFTHSRTAVISLPLSALLTALSQSLPSPLVLPLSSGCQLLSILLDHPPPSQLSTVKMWSPIMKTWKVPPKTTSNLNRDLHLQSQKGGMCKRKRQHLEKDVDEVQGLPPDYPTKQLTTGQSASHQPGRVRLNRVDGDTPAMTMNLYNPTNGKRLGNVTVPVPACFSFRT